MHIDVIPISDLPPGLVHSIIEQKRAKFSTDAYYVEWIATEPWQVIVWEDGTWVSSAQIFERKLLSHGEWIRIAGIGNIRTQAAYQGNGYASVAIQAAVHFASQQRFRFCVLVCSDAEIETYLKQGWFVVRGPTAWLPSDSERVFATGFNTMAVNCVGESWKPGLADLLGVPW